MIIAKIRNLVRYIFLRVTGFNTDNEWEKWGKNNPYYGVLTHEKYRSKNLDENVKLEFFESGKKDIEHIIRTCRRKIDKSFSPEMALDFGCGVGRLTIPLAKIAGHVVGVDVSKSMLNEARNNCEEYNINNVSFFESDDKLSKLNEKFDFIYSLLVFQHIPTERGIRIFEKLLHLLQDGGIAALQITYWKAILGDSFGVPPIDEKKSIPNFINTPSEDPQMQMNAYNLNKLYFLIYSMGIQNIYSEFTDHGGELGCTLYFKKPIREN